MSAAPASSAASVAATAGRQPRPMPALVVTFREAARYPRTRIGIGATAFIVVLALVGPLLAPHSVAEFVGAPFAATSGDAPLGTDYLGRDVLSRLLWGGRNIVWMSVAAATLGMVLGVTFGLLAGYAKGWLDEAIMRTMDVLLALPLIVFVLLFVALLGPKLWLITVLIGIAHAPQVARVTRGATLEVCEREFVQSAEAMGVSRRRILFGEILPNITTPLMVEYGLRIVWSIAGIAALSVLGNGIQPPAADWGLMINENRVGLAQQPLAVLAPVICVALFAFGVNMIAEGIARTVSGVNRSNG